MKSYILFFCSVVSACSATQRPPLDFSVTTFPAEDAQVVVIDQDAYQQFLPSVQDAAVNLQIVDGTGPNGEIITPLRRGQPAPYNGVLFNGPSVARLNVEFRAQAAQCAIMRQTDLDSMRALALRDISLLNASLDSQREVSRIMLRSRDEEISRMFNYIRRQQPQQQNHIWNYVGAVAAGMVVGLTATSLYFILH
jgi:hypothetical protein